MHDHSRQRNSFGRLAGSGIFIARAAACAAFLTLASSSIGSDSGKDAPPRVSAAPASINGAKQVRAKSMDEANKPARLACNSVSVPVIEGAGASGATVGCGERGNPAAHISISNPDDERMDLETLLAWHLAALNLAR